MRVVAILETMWDWESATSAAGYKEAPRFFRINPRNYSGKRLYKLIGPDAQLLVTNACRELVSGPQHHGKPDSIWLAQNLELIEVRRPDSASIDVLLVCGKVAQKAFEQCTYKPKTARIVYMPHPAARQVWTREFIEQKANEIQKGTV